MTTDTLYQQVACFLDKDYHIIAASDRIARAIQLGFNQQQQATVVEVLNCSSYKHWLIQQFKQWQRQTLNPHVFIGFPLLEYLMAQIIADDNDTTIMNVNGAAKQVMAAVRLIAEWQLDLQEIEGFNTVESQKLLQWYQALQAKCQQQQWIAEPDIYQCVITAIAAKQINCQPRYLWVGFDEIPPALAEIRLQLQLQGAEHIDIAPKLAQTAEVKVIAANSTEQEMRYVAESAHKVWQQQQQAQIAVILPNLESRIQEVERCFIQAFMPESQHAHSLLGERPFNISAGLYLDNVPLVHHCMQLLRFSLPSIKVSELEQLLASPYSDILSQDSSFWTERLIEWKHNGRETISFDRLEQRWQETFTDKPFPLTQIWQLRQQPLQSLDQVIELIRQELVAWRYCQRRHLLANEDEVLQLFWSQLQGLSHFQLLRKRWSRAALLQLLSKQLGETVFQQAASGRRVHILGTMEASGLVFDQVFLMGMDDESWPAPSSPNPFLPIELQKQYNLPRSGADRELQLAQSITNQLMHGCRQLHISYAKQQQDKALSISPFFKPYPQQPIDTSNVSQIQPQEEVLWLNDQKAPALAKGESAEGGTGILKSQGACPFQAFAKYRLKLKDAHQESLGLNPRERGILVHRILELFWQQIKTQASLAELTSEQRQHLLAQIIQQAIEELIQQKWLQFGERFWQIETVKLLTMMENWLALELAREPFTVVATEGKKVAQVSGLQITYVVDRIDEVADGNRALIDYKTSANYNAKQWGGMRPEEPQMLLYGTSIDKVQAIAYATVTPKSLGFSGLASSDDYLPKVKPLNDKYAHDWDLPLDWQDMLAKWRLVLTHLADSYQSGDAAVHPKVAIHTCKYCPYAGVCRIDEVQSQQLDSGVRS